MAVNKNNQEHAMTDSNKTDATTKMAPTDINQDGLDKKD
ncbi:MAG: hypothetical protein ACI9PD_001917, partial [Psychrobacter glaciei]